VCTEVVNVWEEIKSKLDIVDVLSEYVRVLPAGQNFRALSPFKREKTPSLMISPQKQIWHDFSTGRGGDIFGFVAEIENCTRAEALKKLAKKAGVTLTPQRPKTETELQVAAQQESHKDRGYQTLDWAASLYHQILLKLLQNPDHAVTQYCKKRGLTSQIIERFCIGYAPAGQFLTQFLAKKHATSDIFVAVGVLKLIEQGQIRDKFSDRLTIPISDLEGRVVGFTARVLPYDTTERPKYLNSSQSEWFDKGNLWFGLNLARRSIIQEKRAILVEGNMDVIALSARGVDIAIASQGTSFTQGQLRLLSRVTRSILLAFDNDSAGVEAGKKLFMQATELGLVVQKLVIPTQYKDIDEYVQSMSAGALDVSVFQTQHYLDFWIETHATELQSTDSLVQKQSLEMVAVILGVTDAVTQDQYINRLGTLTRISQNTIRNLVQKARQNQGSGRQAAVSSLEPDTAAEYTPEHDEQLLVMVQKLVAVSIQPQFAALFSLDFMQKVYVLARSLVPLEPETLDEYCTQNNDQLSIIWSEGISQKDETFAQILRQSVLRALDSHIQQWMLSPTLRDVYLALKQA
jgi:DNA primase